MYTTLPLTVRRTINKVVAFALLSGYWLATCMLVASPAMVLAQTEFKASPRQCVTLREGQPCSVRLSIEWTTDEHVRTCLYGAGETPVKCWAETSGESFKTRLSLPATTEFVLRTDSGTELGRATVTVSWVYRKKRSRRRWRLF